MNWTSLFAHNVLEPGSWSWTVALSADVVATGLSAANLIAGQHRALFAAMSRHHMKQSSCSRRHE
jgi:hypothetical protein